MYKILIEGNARKVKISIGNKVQITSNLLLLFIYRLGILFCMIVNISKKINVRINKHTNIAVSWKKINISNVGLFESWKKLVQEFIFNKR